MKKSNHEDGKGLKTFFLYAVVVLICIIISLVVKFIFVLQQSKYDRQQDFTVAVSKNGKVEELINIDSNGKKLSLLQLKGETVPISTLGKTLGIAIGGQIDVPPTFSLESDVANQLSDFSWRYATVKTDLTLIDLIQLALISRSIKNSDKTIKEIKLPTDAVAVDKVVTNLFTDDTLATDKVSIQIINASNVHGMGARLERVLLNMGGNVVAVSTSQKKESRSQINYTGEEAYTLKKIEKLLGFPVSKTEKQTIATIVITIGEDSRSTKKF